MSVKPELAFDVCWEVYRGAREVLETKRGISALNWKDTGKFLWRPDLPRTVERVGGGFSRWRENRRSRGRTGLRAWCCFGSTTWDSPRMRRRGLSWLERAELGELDGANPPSLRQGTSEPRHVSAEKVFYVRGLAER